jgi:UDP-glucose 4-epimerase
MWAITGATGFIGRHLVERLKTAGIEYRPLRGDIRDPDALSELVRGASVVVHLAGYVHRSLRAEAAQADCRSVNEGGTAALIDAISRISPEAFLIFVSTANVYAPSNSVIAESFETRPTNAYGESKLAAERLALSGRVDATVLRPSMVFGPGCPGNLPRLINLARRGLAVLFGSGSNTKSIVPVDEVVDAIIAVARDKELSRGRVFNVAGVTLTVRRINELVAEGLGRKPFTIRIPLIVARLLGRTGRTYTSSTALDGTALSRLPSFQPAYDAEEILRATARSQA